MKNKYILLRHGETIYQTEKKTLLYPWPDFVTGLTKRGKEQVETAAKKLKSKEVDLVYSSDFLRVKQTAEIIAKELGLRVKIDKRLRDINFGIYSGGPVKKYYCFFSNMRQKFFKRPQKGENWRDVKKRIVSFVKSVEKKNKSKRILVVSHGDPLWIFCGILKRLGEKKLLEYRYEDFRPYKDFYPGPGEFLEIGK